MKPVIPRPARDARPAKGRIADRIAAIIAALTSVLAIIGSLIFFAGFVANDSYFGAIISAFIFTALLGSFAVVPPLIVTRIAHLSYKEGITTKRAIWTLVLTLPWIALAALILAYTPLPFWIGSLALISSILLSVWALASLILDRKTKP